MQSDKNYPALTAYDIERMAMAGGKYSKSGQGWITCCFAHCYFLVKNHRTMPIVAVYLEKDVFIPQSIIGNMAFSSLIAFR